MKADSSSGNKEHKAQPERQSAAAELCDVKRASSRVLVIDDEPDARTLLRLILEPEYEVITAASAAEVRRLLEDRSKPMDLVLMDLRLEGEEDGVALTRELRAEERWKDVPIVAMTAYANTEDVQNALAAGCNEYVPKPFYRKQLLALIQRLIG
ncbi:MAG TPA: response regulator [Candidatus Binataceae bacterium]|nr:response regulator [Candidatus Binataceae bacterium]